MKVSELETPCLIVDRTAFEANLASMAQLLAKLPTMTLYPHYKSNKCLTIAKRQMAEGAGGITCAKLSEAEDLVDGGIGAVVIANQVVQPAKVTRLAALAKRADITVCVDDAANIQALEAACAAADAKLKILVELEVGLNRCGVNANEEFLALVRAVAAAPHLIFDGIQAYAGQLSHETDAAARRAAGEATEARVRELKAYVEAAGFPCHHVAGASTGTVADKTAATPYTQLQAGSYVFMDSTYAELGIPFQQSLFLLTRVLSVRPGRTILDGGVKSFTMDQHAPVLPELPQTKFDLNEEHVILFNPEKSLKVNDLVRLIPGHCCTTVNVHDQLYVVEGDEVVEVWPVTARGRSR